MRMYWWIYDKDHSFRVLFSELIHYYVFLTHNGTLYSHHHLWTITERRVGLSVFKICSYPLLYIYIYIYLNPTRITNLIEFYRKSRETKFFGCEIEFFLRKLDIYYVRHYMDLRSKYPDSILWMNFLLQMVVWVEFLKKIMN